MGNPEGELLKLCNSGPQFLGSGFHPLFQLQIHGPDLAVLTLQGDSGFLIPLEDMFSGLPSVDGDPSLDRALINGNDFAKESSLPDGQEVRVHTSTGRFIGIYRFAEDAGMFRLVKNFYDPD